MIIIFNVNIIKFIRHCWDLRNQVKIWLINEIFYLISKKIPWRKNIFFLRYIVFYKSRYSRIKEEIKEVKGLSCLMAHGNIFRNGEIVRKFKIQKIYRKRIINLSSGSAILWLPFGFVNGSIRQDPEKYIKRSHSSLLNKTQKFYENLAFFR